MIDTILITFRDYISQPTCRNLQQTPDLTEAQNRQRAKIPSGRWAVASVQAKLRTSLNKPLVNDIAAFLVKLKSASPTKALLGTIRSLGEHFALSTRGSVRHRTPRTRQALHRAVCLLASYQIDSRQIEPRSYEYQESFTSYTLSASCKAAFPDWEYRFWNLESAEEWMSSKFPGFMKTWHSYPRTVLKGDAFRAFVLKDMGGLYLDLDIECFQHREHMLNGLDLVLQVAYPGAWDLDNGAFGSTAGHPYWDTYIKLLTERASISPAEGPLRYDHVVRSTGPDVTYDAYLEWGKPEVRHGFVTDIVQKDGLVSMAYPLGEWFFPCLWDAITCHADMNERKRNMDFPEHLAGHHYSVVSWFKELGEKI
ncbi:hypothetical protein WJX74_006132 [Apatococcus lobatus]|uniref:Mannosyltransferase n=1 Tax=Apatococcus lobatus TaxID=904363 RepID=A0AAW1RFG4_9CHLO